jgi:phosphatidylserine decarboxylase
MPSQTARGSAAFRVPIDREAWRFVALIVMITAVAALIVAVASGPVWLTGSVIVLGVILAGAVLAFFRDPERPIPTDPQLVLSPADGRVTAVESSPSATTITIFLSVLNVHINRAPVAGSVAAVNYRSGKFLAAYRPEVPVENEASELVVESEHGAVRTWQIAGLIARRIVCRVRPGQRLQAGERFGLIRFGSCTQVQLPPTARPVVQIGDRVRGGTSVIARWNAPERR